MSSLYLRHFLPHTVKLLLNLVYLLPLLPILILQFPIGYLQFLDMLAWDLQLLTHEFMLGLQQYYGLLQLADCLDVLLEILAAVLI